VEQGPQWPRRGRAEPDLDAGQVLDQASGDRLDRWHRGAAVGGESEGSASGQKRRSSPAVNVPATSSRQATRRSSVAPLRTPRRRVEAPRRAAAAAPAAAPATAPRDGRAVPPARRPGEPASGGTLSGSATPSMVVPSETARLSHTARPPAASSRATRLDLPTPPGPASSTAVPSISRTDTCSGASPRTAAHHSTGWWSSTWPRSARNRVRSAWRATNARGAGRQRVRTTSSSPVQDHCWA
jgi:hypothetical protein